MQKVYSNPDRLLIGHLAQVLEQHGIECYVKNAFLAGGAGELPPLECWPELWGRDDEDNARATALIESVLQAPESGSEWICPDCGEQVEGQFAACWRCGHRAP